MIRISVSRADATVLETETLTAGRIGLVCEFVFSSDWDDLEKVAVFDGEVTKEVMLDENNRAIVPAECMATAGYKLRCGVTGLNAEQVVVLPTVYVYAGKIRESAEIADSSIEEITPSLASQVISRANEALRVANELASDAESGRFDGEDGVSPTLNVTSITNGHRVSITDRDGTDEFDVMNGVNGEDGVSPTIAVSDITGGHVLTITDANGTRTVIILDGATGATGATGVAGSDGYSPTVAITNITGGHRVTITDANGPHTFDVMDGENGEGGSSSHRVYGGSNVQLISTTSAGTYIARLSDLDEGVTVGDFVIGEYIDNVYIYKVIAVANGWAEGYRSEAIKLTGPTKTSDLTNDSGFYVKPSGGIPDSDIASAETWNAKGTYSKPSGGIPKSDLAAAVQDSLGKADTALQSVPSTYRTAAAQDTIDAGKIDKNQGSANAGKFLVVGADGIVAPVTMQTWQGGNY